MSSFVRASNIPTITSADPGESFPFLHTITVVDRVVSVDKSELIQNNIKTESITLKLDSEWEGLSVVINIGNDDPVSVIWSGQPVIIPAEVMTEVGRLDVSVVGYGDDGAVRAVTKQAKSIFNVVASGYVEGDDPVPDPTSILGQLVEAADNANQAAQKFDEAIEDVGDLPELVASAKQSEANALNYAQRAEAAVGTIDGTGQITSAIELTNEDLDDYQSINRCGFYYAASGNTVANKPSDVDAFSMMVIRNGNDTTCQIVIPQTTDGSGAGLITRLVGGAWTSQSGSGSGSVSSISSESINKLFSDRTDEEQQ